MIGRRDAPGAHGSGRHVAKRGDIFEVHVASADSGNRITIIMRDPPGADRSQLRKGSPVTINAKLRDFPGQQSEYITLDDGNCADCRG